MPTVYLLPFTRRIFNYGLSLVSIHQTWAYVNPIISSKSLHFLEMAILSLLPCLRSCNHHYYFFLHSYKNVGISLQIPILIGTSIPSYIYLSLEIYRRNYTYRVLDRYFHQLSFTKSCPYSSIKNSPSFIFVSCTDR